MAQTTAPGRTARVRPATLLILLGSAVVLAGTGSFLILAGERAAAGVLALGSAAGLVAAGAGLRAVEEPRLLFVESAAERAVDAAFLAPLAWVLLPGDPRAGTAALVALSASYVASYLRARGLSLGFPVERMLAARPLLLVAVGVGLLAVGVEAGLWAGAAVALWVAVSRSLEVRRMKEPPAER